MKKNHGYTFVELLLVLMIPVALAAVGGWVFNIIKLTACSFAPLTSEPILRVIGIFLAPLGAVLGFVPHW